MMAKGMAIGFEEGVDNEDYTEPIDALVDDVVDTPITTVEAESGNGDEPTSDAILIYRLLQQYLPMLTQMSVTMYPDAVVGELFPYIDSGLGEVAVRKGRA